MELTNPTWLNTSDVCTFEHVIQISGLQRHVLVELVETGIIAPTGDDQGSLLFHTECIVLARQARQLQDDFELDAAGVVLAMNLLRRIRRLEARVDDLLARLPGQ